MSGRSCRSSSGLCPVTGKEIVQKRTKRLTSRRKHDCADSEQGVRAVDNTLLQEDADMLVPCIFVGTLVVTYSAIVWMFSPNGDVFF